MKKIYFAIFMVISVFLSGCGVSDSSKSMKFFTSDELEGRKIGTEGNLKAQEYIADKFKKYKLTPLKEDFKMPYEHSEMNLLHAKVEIKLPKGEKKELVRGVDYLEAFPSNISGEYNVSFDLHNKDKAAIAVVDKNSMSIDDNEYMVKNNIAILSKAENFKKSLPGSVGGSNIQISNEVYELLKNNKDAKVFIDIKYEDRVITDNNIVGVIKGENSKNAIVISAHFDHVGKSGEVIFRGALDNASGSTALINLAKSLGEYGEKNKFKNDIIFAAFNGEESGIQGSERFVEEISNIYDNIVNINIDCVGGDGKINIFGSEEEILNRCKEYLEKNKVETMVTTESIDTIYMQSDHSSFEKFKHNFIFLINSDDIENVHTTDDTVDKVDTKRIDNLVKGVRDFIINSEDELIESTIKYREKKAAEQGAAYDKNLSNLKEGQFLITENKGEKSIISKDLTFINSEEKNNCKSYEEFKKLYPEVKIPDTFEEGTIFKVIVSCNIKENLDNLSLGEIYDYDISFSNITSIDIMYIKEGEDTKIFLENPNAKNDYYSITIRFTEENYDDDYFDKLLNNYVIKEESVNGIPCKVVYSSNEEELVKFKYYVKENGHKKIIEINPETENSKAIRSVDIAPYIKIIEDGFKNK